jgi:antitoxin ParD1/3/4
MPTIELNAPLDGFVEEQIASGRYRNATEVIGAALRLLAQQARRTEQLRAEVEAAFEDPRPSVPIDEVFARLDKRAAEDAAAAKLGS